MKARLILVLAFAFVAGSVFSAHAEVQNVKVGGDLTVYGISRNLDLKNGKNHATHSGMASIARVKVDADLTDNVSTTVRLLNERYWGSETENNSGTNGTNSNINLDLAYVTLKEFLYSPLSLTVGRQELKIGSGMILGDYDTDNTVSTASPFTQATGNDADLSARKAFDAIRATLNYDPLVIDLLYAKVNTNATLTGADDDHNLYGINANYQLNKANTLEGYFFEKKLGKDRTGAGTAANKSIRTDVIGSRIVNTSVSDLLLSLEAAYQFGTYANAQNQRQNRNAWALETGANYTFSKVKYTPSLTALYAYFKGDSGAANKAWDPMYENQKYGDIANSQFNQSNVHITGGMLSAKPTDDVTLKGEYYAFWWAKPYREGQTISTVRGNSVVMTERQFAGQELDLTATYDYTEDVQFGVMGGLFVPGASFNKANKELATEVIGSMKVTF